MFGTILAENQVFRHKCVSCRLRPFFWRRDQLFVNKNVFSGACGYVSAREPCFS